MKHTKYYCIIVDKGWVVNEGVENNARAKYDWFSDLYSTFNCCCKIQYSCKTEEMYALFQVEKEASTTKIFGSYLFGCDKNPQEMDT